MEHEMFWERKCWVLGPTLRPSEEQRFLSCDVGVQNEQYQLEYEDKRSWFDSKFVFAGS